MLLYDNSTSLGDRNVKDKESVAKLKEKIINERVKHKHPDQKILENHDMAMGNPMSPALFSEKLRKLGFIVEPGGIPGAAAVRAIVPDLDPTSPTFKQKIPKYVSGFYTDRVLPEFSSVLPDWCGVAKREVRGWRNVLYMLYMQKLVTMKDLEAAFGSANGQRSELWRKQHVFER